MDAAVRKNELLLHFISMGGKNIIGIYSKDSSPTFLIYRYLVIFAPQMLLLFMTIY